MTEGSKRIHLQYGRSGLELDLAGLNATVIEPEFVKGLPDEPAAFREAMANPVGRPAARELVSAGETVAVVIPDITRALPNERLLTWLFGELSHVPAENFVIISGTGTHRANTDAEWVRMVGDRIYRNYRCINHSSTDASTLERAGSSPFGYEVYLNREYIRADRRILLGFVEPHFMAGFSGGYKAVFPGIAGLDTIMHYHSAANIGHPRSTWGIIEGNPTQENVRAGGSLIPVDLLINVTLNKHLQITGFFIGDPVLAHEAGCAFCRRTAMVPCRTDFPVVVTTNSGYPLDQNLYQTVKGMSAAAGILRPGGAIITAARCNDGFPEHGNFKSFLFGHDSPEAMLEQIESPGFRQLDQWQVQIFANVLKKGKVALYSGLDPGDVRRAHMEPVGNILEYVDSLLQEYGRDAPVAVLPEGPQTIPYLAHDQASP